MSVDVEVSGARLRKFVTE